MRYTQSHGIHRIAFVCVCCFLSQVLDFISVIIDKQRFMLLTYFRALCAQLIELRLKTKHPYYVEVYMFCLTSNQISLSVHIFGECRGSLSFDNLKIWNLTKKNSIVYFSRNWRICRFLFSFNFPIMRLLSTN